MTTSQFFNEELYLANNPEVAKSITEGKYASGYDEFAQIGQFLERNGVIFNGTNGSDTVQAFGQKSSVIGVKVDTAKVGSRLINTETASLGVGEIDTLLGSPGRNIFYLGNNAAENPTDFYLGNGDQDYGLIRYFDPTSEDAVYLAGKPEDYTLETIDKSVHISKNGDLIGIVENVTKLIADGLFTENGLLLFAPNNSYFARTSQPYFNQPAYLAANPDVQTLIDFGKYSSAWQHFINVGIDEGRQTFFNGVVGNDSFFYPLGNATVVSFPITEYDPNTGAIKTATTGIGDRDHYHGSFGANRFLLGNEGQDFYVGKGDKDYVLIGDFDPKKDQLIIAGNIEDYNLGIYDELYNGVVYKEFQIATKDGDVIARVENGENLKFVQIKSDIPGTNALVAVEYEGLTPVVPSEPIFGTSVDDILTINQGNQLVFAGSGNDLIDAVASLGNNRFYGGTGNDTFILGKGDIAFGEAGSDRFFARTAGGNTLTGGEGADQFWIATGEIPQDVNTITDFTIGEDVIGIAGSGGNFGKLAFTQQNQDLLVSLSSSNLAVLKGVEAANLSASSFVFV
jgi:Ca2+-binding RTX toxin-like protein